MTSAAIEHRWQILQAKTLESYLQAHPMGVFDGAGWTWLLVLLLLPMAGVCLHLRYRDGTRKPPDMMQKMTAFFAAGTPARLGLGAALLIVAALIVMTDRYESYHMKTLRHEGVRVPCEIIGFVKSGVLFYEPLVFFIKQGGGGAVIRDTHGITALDGLSLAKGDKAELLYLKDKPEMARIDRGLIDYLQSVLRWFFAGSLLGLVRCFFPKKRRPPGPAVTGKKRP